MLLKRKNDKSMINRLNGVPYGDLAAIAARYHHKRGCLAKYSFAKSGSKEIQQYEGHQKVMAQVIEEFNKSIVEYGQVTLLSSIRDCFVELANERSDVEATAYPLRKKSVLSVCYQFIVIVSSSCIQCAVSVLVVCYQT